MRTNFLVIQMTAKLPTTVVKKYNENLELQIKKGEYNIKKYRPLFTIPTTAGSGAEVSSNAVIYIKKIKYSVEDKSLLPEKFLLIPELIIGLKKNLKSNLFYFIFA